MLHWFYRQLMYTTIVIADRKFSDQHINGPETFKVKNCPKFFDLYAEIYGVTIERIDVTHYYVGSPILTVQFTESQSFTNDK